MRLRRDPKAQAEVHNHALVVIEQQALAGPFCWQQAFAKPQPLHLEIGAGRGHFLIAAAAAQPGLNFLGLERRAEPLYNALQQLAEPYPANLRLLQAEATLLTQMFAAGELTQIYLFFPDPWPKKRHAARRLTAPGFIAQYQHILRPAGRVVFKTDGAAFYHWSVENFIAAGWQPAALCEDKPLAPGETATNYERRFRELGLPIYYAEFIAPACR